MEQFLTCSLRKGLAMAQMFYDPERLGRRRLPDNKQYRADLQGRSDLLLSALQDLVASNYPKTPNSNFGIYYRTLGREFARIQQSMEYINNDKIFTQTRIQFLQQILGERLFLSSQIIPVGYNDVSYRNYLTSIKNAYLKGSSRSSIETSIKNLTGQTINLKELYLEARKPGSSYSVVDTHKMLIEVFVDDLVASGKSLSDISSELNFYVNLIRPAHVLYDTKFIWTETFDINKTHDIFFGDTGGGCIPVYLYEPFSEPVVLAKQIMVVSPLLADTEGVYKISSMHSLELVIYLENGVKVIVEPGINGTQIYGINGKRIEFEDLDIDQYIKLVSVIIPGDFQFYWMPPDLVTDYNSRFYKEVYQKPAFQEFVKKLMDSHGRFPVQIRTTETTLCDRWVQDALQPMYEDLRKNCQDRPESKKQYTITLAEHMWTPRFSLLDNGQGISLGREVTGDVYSFTLPYAPLTDGSGSPATSNNISVWKDSTQIYGSVQAVDSSAARVSLFDTTTYWDASGGGVPAIGDTFTFNYFYKTGITDSTASTECLFGIAQWQLPDVPVSNGDGSNILALPSDVRVSVDGTYIPDAVLALNPIAGYVTLQYYADFWNASPLGRSPTLGDEIAFDYYQSGISTYSMLWDDVARNLDDDMIFDGVESSDDPTRTPVSIADPLTIGYKFRTDLLHHASVLNSPDTLLLNNYQKPATRASIINRQDTLNHYNYFFSPEHLYDTSSQIILNDDYLDQPTEPLLKLNAGTPPFQKTYAYQPSLIHERKLQDIRKHHHPLMYSDLLLKEYHYGDENVSLNSICDQAGYSFKIRFREELNKIHECDPWILFDTAVTNVEDVTIPSDSVGVINLRVLTKKLRQNFILRETTSTKVTSNANINPPDGYSIYIPMGTPQSVFYMPETIVYQPPGLDTINFPALPIVKDYATLATPADIIVKINDVVTPGLISTIDPILGIIQFFSAQQGVTISFVYNIRSVGQTMVLDQDRSRTFDWTQVFPTICYDGFDERANLHFHEYVNFVSDYGSGIKFKYFNKDTYQIEEHVFDGPVFESYNPYEDEISSPESFPNALVRIRNPIGPVDLLSLMMNHEYLNESSIRIRKKTIRELLPDRTFRISNVTEVLPV
jgi:hypothetical protein